MQTLVMLLALKFIAWLVEVGGLLSLHKWASIMHMDLAKGPSSGRAFCRAMPDCSIQSGSCSSLPAEPWPQYGP